MKSLLPSLKERKRYIVFDVASDKPVAESDVCAAITDGVQWYVGQRGRAKAGMQFLHELWNPKSQRGIVRVSHTSVDKLRSAFLFVSSIHGIKSSVSTAAVSGIVKKVKSYVAG